MTAWLEHGLLIIEEEGLRESIWIYSRFGGEQGMNFRGTGSQNGKKPGPRRKPPKTPKTMGSWLGNFKRDWMA